MLVPQLLLETLEDLSGSDFNKFQFYLGLKILMNCKQIPRSQLESQHRHDTVKKMIDCYGEELAVNVTVKILKIMKHNNAAEELQKKHTEGATALEKVSHPLVASSSASGLPTGQTIFADGATGAIALWAPTVSNGRVIISGNVGGNVDCNTGSNGSMFISGNIGGNVVNNVSRQAPTVYHFHYHSNK